MIYFEAKTVDLLVVLPSDTKILFQAEEQKVILLFASVHTVFFCMVQFAGSLDLSALGLASLQTYPGSERFLLVALFEVLKKRKKKKKQA